MWSVIYYSSVEEPHSLVEIWGGNAVCLKGSEIFCSDYAGFFRAAKSHSL